jgi:hypothetical protein
MKTISAYPRLILLVFACAIAASVNHAAGTVTLDGAVSTNTLASGTSTNVNHTTGAGTDRLMLVGVSWNSGTSARTISSVTFTPNGGSALALSGVRTQQVASTTYRYAAIYRLLNPPSGQAGTVTVTFSASVSSGIVVGVANFAGVDQTTPLGSSNGASATNTTPSVSLTGLNGDELVFDTVFIGGNPPPSLTNDLSQARLWTNGIGNARGAASTKQATATSVTMSWTASGTGGPWASVAVAIKPAGEDTTPPTVTINQAAGQADPTNASPINFTVVFSEPVTDFATGDVTLDGTAGATTATVTGSGTTYNVAVSGMTGSGTVIASLDAEVAHDAAGNPSAASTSTDNSVTYDVTPPTVTINQAAGQVDPTSSSPINFTVEFSKTVTDFATGDVTLSGTAGATTAVVTGSGTTYNVAVSGMTISGTIIASLAAGVAHDTAGNPNEASTSTDDTVTYNDTTPPTVTINQAAGQADPTSASPINFTVVFSEPVGDFATGDVTLDGTAGATTATVTGSGTTYNVAVSGMTGSGTVIASLYAEVAHDAAGNPSAASTSTDNSVTYDVTAPTVTINQAAGQADPTGVSPINFTVVFSEAVTDFATGDVTLSGTATNGATTATVTGSGTTYDVAVSGMTNAGTVIASITAGVAHDAAGNPSAASTSTDNEVTYTGLKITLDGAVSTAKSTNTVSDAITVTNTTGTGGNRLMLVGVSWNSSGSARTISSVTFTPNGESPVSLTEVKTQQPGATAYRYAAIYRLLNPPSGQTGTVTVTFSGSVANGIIVGVANFAGVDQTTPLGTPTGAGTTNTAPSVTLTGLNGDELVFDTVFIGGAPPPTLTNSTSQTRLWTNSISNAGGAASTAQAVATSVTMSWTASGSGPWAIVAVPIKPAGADTTPPTVTINQATSQVDPTNASPINFTVVFSEAVTDFATGDVDLSSSTAPGTLTGTVTGSGTTYNVAVSGMTGSGTVTATIAAGVAHDAAGNPSEASTNTDNTVIYDVTAPTVTINQAAGQADPTSASPINFTVVFSEPVADFATGDVSLSGTAGATTATVTGSGTIYNVAVSGMAGSGNVIASLAAGVAHDAAGNPNEASTSSDDTVTYNDTTPPTVTINQAAGQADPTSASPINFTVVFSEPVADFATGDVSLSGTAGATTATVTGSGTIYNVAVSGMSGSGTVNASVDAGVAHDAAGNPSEASTSTDNTVTYDVTAPTVTINQAAGQADPTSASPINFTVVFSKSVTDFATGDVTLSGTATNGATTATVTGNGTTYNVAVSGMTNSGTIIASISAGVAHDPVGNSNEASTSTDNQVTYQEPPFGYVGDIGSVSSNSAGTTLKIPVGAGGVAAGNTIIVGFASRGASTYNTPFVTDSAGNTYNLATNAITYTHGRAYLFYAHVGTALTNDNNITITTSSVSNRVAVASVFHGLMDTGVLDQALANPTGSSTTMQGNDPTVGPTASTVQADELIIGVIGTEEATDAGVGTWQNGFTAGPQIKSSGTTAYEWRVSMGYQTVSATGTFTAAKTVANNPYWAATIATFKAATADATAPTVTISQAAGQADPTNASPINFTVVFSEAVTDFATGDVDLSSSTAPGTLTGTVTGSGTTYNVAVSGMTGSGTVIASLAAGVAHDAAGNPSEPSTSTDNMVTYDVTTPTVTIDQAAGQADPTNASPINFTVVFSEVVTDFATGDVDLSSSTAPGTLIGTVTGSGTTYNVAVSGMTGSGTVIASLAAGVAHDAAGNPSEASTSTDNMVTYDVTTPTVTINQAVGQADPTSGSPINFTVVFSEPVTDFATGDVTLDGTAGATTATVTGNGTTYNVAVSGMTGSGTVIASLATGVAHDAAGNPNDASTSTDNVVTLSVTNVIASIINNHNGTYTLNLLGTPGAEYYLVTNANLRASMTLWNAVEAGTHTAGSDGKWSATVSSPAPMYFRAKAVNPAP